MKMLKSRPVTPVAPATPRVAAVPAPRNRKLALVAAPVQETQAAVRAAVPAAMAAPAAALQQTHSFVGLLAQTALRSAGNAAASAALLPLFARPETGAELLEIQGAIVERLLELQQGWWAGWTAWLEEVAQLRRADTLSEHLEQFYNLGEQFTQMFRAQGTDLVDLQDVVQVDYGYWVARKVRDTGG